VRGIDKELKLGCVAVIFDMRSDASAEDIEREVKGMRRG